MKTLSYRVLYILFELSFFLFIVFAIGFTFIEGRDLINSDHAADYTVGAFDSNVIHKEEISIGQSPLEKADVENYGWVFKLQFTQYQRQNIYVSPGRSSNYLHIFYSVCTTQVCAIAQSEFRFYD